MTAFVRFRSTRLRFVPNLLMSALILLTSCSTAPAVSVPPPRPPILQLPPALPAEGPAIPFRSPNPLGDPQLTVEPFTEIGQLQACLALGQTVYGVALQNTNVRESPTLNACRVGRIPRGTLVAVTGLVTTATTLTATAAPTDTTADLLVEPITLGEPITGTLEELRALTKTVTTTLLPTLVPTVEPPGSTVLAGANGTQNPEETAAAARLGYLEDIQPIFQRNCIACHSTVVKQKNLQVTAYAPLLAGSSSGPVVIPGDSAASILWQQIDAGVMPLIGELRPEEKALIRQWIDDGALERRQSPALGPATQVAVANNTASDPANENTIEAASALWLTVADESIDPVPDLCENPIDRPQQVVSADLILPISCGVQPRAAQLQSLLQSLSIVPAAAFAAPNVAASANNRALAANRAALAPAVESAAAPPGVVPAAPVGAVPQAGLQAAALGLGVPTDSDTWLTPRGGFCIDQHFTQNDRGITAITFAPDGRLFVALDSRLDGEQDTNILYDAYHPSRSIVIYDPNTRFTPNEIMRESSRITGLAYANGALFLNRAGEVGWIQDGGSYRTLAGGFAVNSQLFHANNGIAITNGYVYISAGGVRDGYSDGPLVGISEAGAQNVVSGGNRFAARLLRAPLDRLINEYNIELFETAARGLRNPYGLTVDPSGRLWFTDNGATNVPENVSAGDEVNLYVVAASPPGTPEDATPYYGFPLALTTPQPWYTGPVVDLFNTAAPTGITWAYGTIFFGQYGRDPGLYRLGRAGDGQIIAERVMLAWPLLALTTAPDGALWIGTGSGGLYRMTPGC